MFYKMKKLMQSTKRFVSIADDLINGRLIKRHLFKKTKYCENQIFYFDVL